MFHDCCYVSKYFLHFWHCYASSVFFTWIIIYIRLYMSCLWKQFPDEMIHQKTLEKKAPIFFWFKFGDRKIWDIFYKCQNFNWWPVYPVITHWTYTFLSPWALLLVPAKHPQPGSRNLFLFFLWTLSARWKFLIKLSHTDKGQIPQPCVC